MVEGKRGGRVRREGREKLASWPPGSLEKEETVFQLPTEEVRREKGCGSETGERGIGLWKEHWGPYPGWDGGASSGSCQRRDPRHTWQEPAGRQRGALSHPLEERGEAAHSTQLFSQAL